MEKKTYVIYKLTGNMVDSGNGNSHFDVSEFVVGYVEGTEDDARRVCENIKSNEPGYYSVPEDNEHIYYPQYRYWDLPKLD